MSGNKKISQLVELIASDVVGSDLLAIVDMSNHETKKITVTNLAAFLNNSGSMFAVHSLTADTASYVLGSNVVGSVLSASFALKSYNSDSASYSVNSLLSTTSSYSTTASFALNVNNAGGALITGSLVPITASWANNVISARSASFLIYTGGGNNGTASFAIKSQLSINSDTASFLNGNALSASYAKSSSVSDTSTVSISSSFLNWQPGLNTGTASYALVAGDTISSIQNFGIYLPNTQSIRVAQLDNVSVPSVTSLPIYTGVEAVGTVIVPYTSSIPVNEFVSLMICDRNTGISTTIDSTPIYFVLSPTIGMWDTYDTGTIKIPYTLMGSQSLNGNYQIFVTASSTKITLDPSRLTKFDLNSLNTSLTVNSDIPLVFTVFPANTLINFSSSAGGPYRDTYLNINNATGSNNILTVDVNSGSVTDVRYLWNLNNLDTFRASRNPSLYNIVGSLPSTITKFEAFSSSLTTFPDFSATTASYINVNSNNIPFIQNLPVTMSLTPSSSLDISNNPLYTLGTLPYGVAIFKCNNTLLNNTPTFFNGMLSMSMTGNSNLTTWASSLPSTLGYLDVSYSPITALTSLPSTLKFIYAFSSSLTQTAMDSICSQSVSNGQVSGSMDIRGNGTPYVSTVATYINTLVFNQSWTVLYDT